MASMRCLHPITNGMVYVPEDVVRTDGLRQIHLHVSTSGTSVQGEGLKPYIYNCQYIKYIRE